MFSSVFREREALGRRQLSEPSRQASPAGLRMERMKGLAGSKAFPEETRLTDLQGATLAEGQPAKLGIKSRSPVLRQPRPLPLGT